MGEIRHRLADCAAFDFCVAFVADGGLQALVDSFNELKKHGVRGRLLTSTYLSFNSPDVFRKLLEYDNIEVRVFQGNLHAKGYVFDEGNTSTVIAVSYTHLDVYKRQGWALQRPGRYLIEDDFDCEFRLAGKPIPPLAAIDAPGSVIYTNTFSKSLSSALRLAYMVLPDRLIERYRQELGFSASTVSSVSYTHLDVYKRQGKAAPDL